MRVVIVGEVGVICDNKDRVSCTFQEIVPMFELIDDSEEFSIVNWVSLFHSRECLRKVFAWPEYGVSVTVCHFLVCLVEYCTSGEMRCVNFQDKLLFLVWRYENGFWGDDAF
jgi:hypothetical protein